MSVVGAAAAFISFVTGIGDPITAPAIGREIEGEIPHDLPPVEFVAEAPDEDHSQ